MNDIIERMRSGKRISETDSDFPRLCEEIENTRRLVAELNTGYHSPDEVRSLLERIWGQSLDASVRMFPPFYTAFGKTTRVGKNVFVNFGCTFLDQGGITLEDGEIFADEISYVKENKQEIGIEIHSGRNRIVRRIFEFLGYTVTKLDRVYYAGLTKKNLKRGAWRFLSREEVERLKSGQYE